MDEFDYWQEISKTVHDGYCNSNVEAPPMTSAERAAYKKELREREARRRPPGFAAWPEPTTEGDST